MPLAPFPFAVVDEDGGSRSASSIARADRLVEDGAVNAERDDRRRDRETAGRDDAGRPSRCHQDQIQLVEVVDRPGLEVVELEEREAHVLAPTDMLRLHHRGTDPDTRRHRIVLSRVCEAERDGVLLVLAEWPGIADREEGDLDAGHRQFVQDITAGVAVSHQTEWGQQVEIHRGCCRGRAMNSPGRAVLRADGRVGLVFYDADWPLATWSNVPLHGGSCGTRPRTFGPSHRARGCPQRARCPFMVGTALPLGSLWAMILALLSCVLLMIRTPVGKANIAGRAGGLQRVHAEGSLALDSRGVIRLRGKFGARGETFNPLWHRLSARCRRDPDRVCLGQELGRDRVGEHFDVSDRPQDRVARRASGVKRGEVTDQRQHLGAEE